MFETGIKDIYAEIHLFGKCGMVNEDRLKQVGITEELLEAATNLVHAIGMPVNMATICIENFLIATTRISDINQIKPLCDLFWSHKDFLKTFVTCVDCYNNCSKDHPHVDHIIKYTLMDVIVLAETRFMFDESTVDDFYYLLEQLELADQLNLSSEALELISFELLTDSLLHLESNGALLVQTMDEDKEWLDAPSMNFFTDIKEFKEHQDVEQLQRKHNESHSYVKSHKAAEKLIGTIYHKTNLKVKVVEVLNDSRLPFESDDELYSQI